MKFDNQLDITSIFLAIELVYDVHSIADIEK